MDKISSKLKIMSKRIIKTHTDDKAKYNNTAEVEGWYSTAPVKLYTAQLGQGCTQLLVQYCTMLITHFGHTLKTSLNVDNNVRREITCISCFTTTTHNIKIIS